MKIKETFYEIAGISLKNVSAKVKNIEIQDDLLFTHKGLSGPLILNLSSYLAFEKLPIILTLNFSGLSFDEQDAELIKILAENPKKNISNLLQKYLPAAMAEEFLKKHGIVPDKKSFEINSKERKIIAGFLSEYKVELTEKDTPFMVTAGGVELNEVDRNLQSKIVDGLYFAGEILNLDGLCGGYNLQACFSMGYIVGNSLTVGKIQNNM
jgi:predicted Rossmann fold flavoprotein